jgi:hypothetical protein
MQVALRFWRGWTAARDGQWRRVEPDKLIAVTDWPRLARALASDLAMDRDTIEPAIITRFATPWPVAESMPAWQAMVGQSPKTG